MLYCLLFPGRGGPGKRWITRREAVSPLRLSQTHLPPQLTFSTLLLPLAAPNHLQAHSSSAEAQSVLGLPPPLGKSESIPTRASGPHTCSQAGADQNAPPARTRAQQVPKCAHSLTHSLALINAELRKNGQSPFLTPSPPLPPLPSVCGHRFPRFPGCPSPPPRSSTSAK